MTVKRAIIEEGDPMPCHMDNVVHTRELSKKTYADNRTQVNFVPKLIVWYREVNNHE